MGNVSQMLNPLTPMAFLAPDVGYPFTIATYVIVGSTGAFIWDILTNIRSDYQLLFNHRIAFPTIVYFLSRASVLVSTLSNAVIRTAPLGRHCQIFQTTTCVLYHIAFSSTALLFFLRVRAIFNRNKYIVAFFLVLWLGVLGGSATVATIGGSSPLGPTQYCYPKPSKPYIGASPITLAINDTFVFLAISWRLLANSWSDPVTKPPLKAAVFGQYLPAFSRAMLQDGQVYYLVTMVSNVIAVITVTLPAVPPAYRFMYVFNCAVTNMMACRVYRHTKFGHVREDSISTKWMVSHSGRGVVPTLLRFAVPSDADSAMSGSEKDSGSFGSGAELLNQSRLSADDRKSDWRMRVLIAVTIGMMILVPAICVYLCRRRNHP